MGRESELSATGLYRVISILFSSLPRSPQAWGRGMLVSVSVVGVHGPLSTVYAYYYCQRPATDLVGGNASGRAAEDGISYSALRSHLLEGVAQNLNERLAAAARPVNVDGEGLTGAALDDLLGNRDRPYGLASG